jgi:type IV pilus assembly protein PilB
MTQSSKLSRAVALRSDVSPFGRSLIQAGYVDNEQMQQALMETRKSGRPLTEILESLTGRQLSPDLLRQYKKQQLFELKVLYGVESLDPEISEISNHQVGQLIDTLLPIDICRRYRLVPLSKTETQPPSVLVAMVDPDNLDAQDDLTRILRPQGIALQRMVITLEDYQQLISRYLDDQLARQKQMEVEKAVDIKQDLENLDNLDSLGDAPDEGEADLGEALKGAEDAPVINLVNRILAKALQEGVSDIHVEPQEEYLRIRFGKMGCCAKLLNPYLKKYSQRFRLASKLWRSWILRNDDCLKMGKSGGCSRVAKLTFGSAHCPAAMARKLFCESWTTSPLS